MNDFFQFLGFITCFIAVVFVIVSCINVWGLEYRFTKLETKVRKAEEPTDE